MNHRMKRLILFIIIFICQCNLGPHYSNHPPNAPSTWKFSRVSAEVQSKNGNIPWWNNFSDKQLTHLVNQSLQNNLDLKMAGARIKQARALLKIAKSYQYPFVSLGFSTEYTKQDQLDSISQRFNRNGVNISAQLTVSYEIDLWNKYKRQVDIAKINIYSAIYEKQLVTLLLISDIANTYFKYLALNQRYILIKNSIRNEKTISKMTSLKQRSGMTSQLDLYQSKANLSSLESQLPGIHLDRNQLENALSILVGKQVNDLKLNKRRIFQIIIPANIPVGLPSHLLRRRPDILQAEASLLSAHGNIQIARAYMFPTLTLTAKGGYVSDQLFTFNKRSFTQYSIGLDLTIPIFKGGQLSGEYEKNKYRYQELLYNYQKVILTAFKEVEDYLTAIKLITIQEKSIFKEAQFNKKAYEIAILQYRRGLSDYTTVLTIYRSLLSSQNSVIQIRLLKLLAIVGLYKALGGGW